MSLYSYHGSCCDFDPHSLCALQVCAAEWRTFVNVRQWHFPWAETTDTQSRTNNTHAPGLHRFLRHQEYQCICLSQIIHIQILVHLKRNCPSCKQGLHWIPFNKYPFFSFYKTNTVSENALIFLLHFSASICHFGL